MNARIAPERRFHVGRDRVLALERPRNQQVQRRIFLAQRAPRLRELDQALVADDASHEAHQQGAFRNLIASANELRRLRRDACRIELSVGIDAVNASVFEHLDLFGRAESFAIATSRSDSLTQMT